MLNFICLIYEHILAERIGYKSKAKLTVTEYQVYIQGYCRVYIQVLTKRGTLEDAWLEVESLTAPHLLNTAILLVQYVLSPIMQIPLIP